MKAVCSRVRANVLVIAESGKEESYIKNDNRFSRSRHHVSLFPLPASILFHEGGL
jgi:hypothetical protein